MEMYSSNSIESLPSFLPVPEPLQSRNNSKALLKSNYKGENRKGMDQGPEAKLEWGWGSRGEWFPPRHGSGQSPHQLLGFAGQDFLTHLMHILFYFRH